jgi:hypothetical protein
MDTLERMKCTEALSMMMKEMVDLDFSAYGSLYFAKGPVRKERRLDYNTIYCVGPHCGAKYWKSGLGESGLFRDEVPDNGPCEFTRFFTA